MKFWVHFKLVILFVFRLKSIRRYTEIENRFNNCLSEGKKHHFVLGRLGALHTNQASGDVAYLVTTKWSVASN